MKTLIRSVPLLAGSLLLAACATSPEGYPIIHPQVAEYVGQGFGPAFFSGLLAILLSALFPGLGGAVPV